MTPKQSKVYHFLREYWDKHKYGPTLDEIAEEVGLPNRQASRRIVEALKQKGLAAGDPRAPRSARPVTLEWPPK